MLNRAQIENDNPLTRPFLVTRRQGQACKLPFARTGDTDDYETRRRERHRVNSSCCLYSLSRARGRAVNMKSAVTFASSFGSSL